MCIIVGGFKQDLFEINGLIDIFEGVIKPAQMKHPVILSEAKNLLFTTVNKILNRRSFTVVQDDNKNITL